MGYERALVRPYADTDSPLKPVVVRRFAPVQHGFAASAIKEAPHTAHHVPFRTRSAPTRRKMRENQVLSRALTILVKAKKPHAKDADGGRLQC